MALVTAATIAAATALTPGVGQAYSINRQREASQDNKRAARLEKRKAAIQNARERRRAAAEAQVMRSRVQAEQAATGFSTSGQTQQMGAINSQLAGQLATSNRIEGLNRGIINAQTSANNAQTQAGYGQAFGQLSGQLGFGLGSMIKSGILNPGGSFFSQAPGQTTMSNPGFSNQFQL